MKSRLKDRVLQKKLDELSDGDFSKQLALNYKRICSDLDLKSPRTRKPTHRQQGHGQHRRRGEEVHDSAFRREAERKPCRP